MTIASLVGLTFLLSVICIILFVADWEIGFNKLLKIFKFSMPILPLSLMCWVLAYCQEDIIIDRIEYYPIENIEIGDGTTIAVSAYWENLKPKLGGPRHKEQKHWSNIKLVNVNEQLQVNIENSEDYFLRTKFVKRGPYLGIWMNNQQILVGIVNKKDINKEIIPNNK